MDWQRELDELIQRTMASAKDVEPNQSRILPSLSVRPSKRLPKRILGCPVSASRYSVPGWGFRFYLLSGALGGLGAGTGEGSLLTPGESGMSRQSNAYTKSPFEVFPIGKHNTGLPTLSIGGAGARFGVCANAGDERSTNAKDAFFISTSQSDRRYRRWPKPIPRCNAFCRRAPTERLVSFAILTTGVRAFE